MIYNLITQTNKSKRQKSFFAFTLAEILITLGIIGIVSALTIPTLIQNHNIKIWDTSSLVFKKKLEVALKTMNTQSTLAGHVSTENFVSELSKHFKINKICDNTRLTDCFSPTMTMRTNLINIDLREISNAADFGQSTWNTNIVGTQFANGTNALIAYNPECKQDPFSNSITGSDCLAILYDVSGEKLPNHLSNDIRNNEYIKKIGTKSICAFEVGNTCYSTTPFEAPPHTWKACTTSGTTTNQEDLTFMQKYGLSYCMNSSYGKDDYWAGAVKVCGGVDKLPTKAQLAEIANKIYGSTDISDEVHYSGTRNDNIVESLGFQYSSDTHFYIWSKEEQSAHLSYARFFYPTYTKWGGLYRHNSYRQTVCVGD